MQAESRIRFAVLAAGLLLAGRLATAQQVATERSTRTTSLDYAGTFELQNTMGSITIVGTEKQGVELQVAKTVRAADRQLVQQGVVQTQVFVSGDARKRVVKTIATGAGQPRWSSVVDYTVKVPRTVHVTVTNHSGDVIRVSNITGSVTIKNVNGAISIDSLMGPVHVESINGNITANFSRLADVSLFTVNGSIELRVPPGAGFDWTAETLQGQVLSALPLRVALIPQKSGSTYRSRVNNGGNSVLTTSVMGKVYLLGTSNSVAQARNIAPSRERVAAAMAQPHVEDVSETLESMVGSVLISPPTATRFIVQRNDFNGDFAFKTDLGNVFVGEVRGSADVTTRAGEITLGSVNGNCGALSYGGPINLGEIGGVVNARTSGGDVRVRVARRGGVVATDGGNVDVFYSGGPITLLSGGGDVSLRQAMDDVHAETRSGDLFLVFDGAVKSAKVRANAVGGNVILNLPPKFGADIDATVITTADDTNHIVSEFAGLNVVREKTGNRTTIHATGKINGGGEKVVLRAVNGDIHIRNRIMPRLVVIDERK